VIERIIEPSEDELARAKDIIARGKAKAKQMKDRSPEEIWTEFDEVRDRISSQFTDDDVEAWQAFKSFSRDRAPLYEALASMPSEPWQLTDSDAQIVVDALTNPPEPSARLIEMMRSFHDEFEMEIEDTEEYLSSLPTCEPWFDRNPEAKASVERGLQEAALGEAHYLGSYKGIRRYYL